jgi:DNA-binding FadR family transcriptional regulator
MTNAQRTLRQRNMTGRGKTRSAKGNIHAKIERAIGERILSGEFVPGALLPNEADWGKTYGASRTAVREAIKSLTAKGLIQSRPKIGSRVEPRARWNMLDRDVLEWHRAAMDRKAFLASTQEARRLVEPGIAELAARKHSPAQLERLVAAYHAMAGATGQKDMVASDVEFHDALLACANNELAGALLHHHRTGTHQPLRLHHPQEPALFPGAQTAPEHCPCRRHGRRACRPRRHAGASDGYRQRHHCHSRPPEEALTRVLRKG